MKIINTLFLVRKIKKMKNLKNGNIFLHNGFIRDDKK